MIVVDAHLDIAFNALCFGRDYRLSTLETRRLETDPEMRRLAGVASVSLPDALMGRVALVCATLFVAPYDETVTPWSKLRYKTPREAHDLALKQWDVYQRLADKSERFRPVRTLAEMDAVLATWADGSPMSGRQQGFILLMENADAILEPRQFEEWYGRGVRIVGPAWAATRYCAGTGEPGPLTRLGEELLDVMASFNAILDLSHMAEKAYLQAIDRYPGVIIASHSNPRHFCNTDRHLSDEMILRLAERDGVMGLNLYNRFLSNTWRNGDRKDVITFDIMLDCIDYVCQLTGSPAHIGIGTDMDGGFGAESIPQGLDTITDLLKIGEGLAARGYTAQDVEAVLSGNMLHKLRQVLPPG